MPRGVYPRKKKCVAVHSAAPKTRPTVTLSTTPAEVMTALQLRQPSGELLGTLYVDPDGIRFRLPDAKLDHTLTWNTLGSASKMKLSLG